jgi:hypothetical protein
MITTTTIQRFTNMAWCGEILCAATQRCRLCISMADLCVFVMIPRGSAVANFTAMNAAAQLCNDVLLRP